MSVTYIVTDRFVKGFNCIFMFPEQTFNVNHTKTQRHEIQKYPISGISFFISFRIFAAQKK
jgi:hypothetical protein